MHHPLWPDHHGKRVWGGSIPSTDSEYVKLFNQAAGAPSQKEALEYRRELGEARPEHLQGAAGRRTRQKAALEEPSRRLVAELRGDAYEGAAGSNVRPAVWRYHEKPSEEPQAWEPPPKLGFMELINQYEIMQQQQKQLQQQRHEQQMLRQQRLFEGAFGAASDRHGGAMRVAVGGPEHLDSHLAGGRVDPNQEAVGERLYEGAAGCRSAWRSPRQEGLRAAPGAAVSQLGPSELRVARLKDFEGAAGCLSGALSGLAPKELQPVAEGFRSWPRQEAGLGAGYLARSPRDREIIDSIIAGLELTIKP